MAVTFSPIVLSSKPVEDAMIPFPMPLIPPPDTSTYFMAAVGAKPGFCQAGRREVGNSHEM